MPEPAVSADLLNDLIEGRTYAYGQVSAEAELARLARDCRDISLAEPSRDASRRLAEKFERVLAGTSRPWWEGWFGPAGRPLAQRLAAGALLVAAAGGGTSAATGVPPHELLLDAASLVRSVVVNLGPGSDGSNAAPTPDASSSPSGSTPAASPTATITPEPSPTPQPAQGAIATPDPEPDDDDDETRTPEPGDDDDDDDDNSGRGGGS